MGGSFTGYLIPGIFFILYALYWCIYQWRKYYVGQYKLGKQEQADVQYPCKIKNRWGRFPWEGTTKIFICTIGFMYELFVDGWQQHHIASDSIVHMLTYFFYGTSGLVDIIERNKKCVPKQAPSIVLILASVQHAVGLGFNLHDRYKVDIMMHTMLLYAVYYTIFMMSLELRYPDSIFISLGRAFGFGLQGSWTIQIGCMLYPPIKGMHRWVPGDPNTYVLDVINDKLMRPYWNVSVNATEDAYMDYRIKKNVHDEIMLVANAYGIYMFVVLVVIIFIGGLVNLHYKNITDDADDYHFLPEEILHDDN